MTQDARNKIKKIARQAFAGKTDDTTALRKIYSLAEDNEEWDSEDDNDDDYDDDEDDDEEEGNLLDDLLNLIPDDD